MDKDVGNLCDCRHRSLMVLCMLRRKSADSTIWPILQSRKITAHFYLTLGKLPCIFFHRRHQWRCPISGMCIWQTVDEVFEITALGRDCFSFFAALFDTFRLHTGPISARTQAIWPKEFSCEYLTSRILTIEAAERHWASWSGSDWIDLVLISAVYSKSFQPAALPPSDLQRPSTSIYWSDLLPFPIVSNHPLKLLPDLITDLIWFSSTQIKAFTDLHNGSTSSPKAACLGPMER